MAKEIICESEASRARILATPGNCDEFERNITNNPQLVSATQHLSLVDENYIVVGGYIEASLKEKIVKGEYIDFARLLPRNRGLGDEHRLELINRGGQTYFVPANREVGTISSFHK